MDFDLNTYSAQKALYEEASSIDFNEDMFEVYPKIKVAETIVEARKLDCDNLENIISELI